MWDGLFRRPCSHYLHSYLLSRLTQWICTNPSKETCSLRWNHMWMPTPTPLESLIIFVSMKGFFRLVIYITYTIIAPVRRRSSILCLTGTIVKDSRSYKTIVYVKHSRLLCLKELSSLVLKFVIHEIIRAGQASGSTRRKWNKMRSSHLESVHPTANRARLL